MMDSAEKQAEKNKAIPNVSPVEGQFSIFTFHIFHPHFCMENTHTNSPLRNLFIIPSMT